jgi:hypothetical protein
MPYITKERREELNTKVDFQSPGELNYAITILCLEYLAQGKVNYARMNEVMGALECAKMELYRRLISQYEDQKMAENGDVYFAEEA